MNKINTKVIIGMVCTVLFFAAAVFCGSRYTMAQHEYKESEESYIALAEEYVLPKEQASIVIPTIAGTENKYAELKSSPVEVDFDSLTQQAARGEVSAWLYCEGTVINYPVMHCDDNQYYLYHQLNGNENACGTLFIDCKNKGDFTDMNTVIYGHHMADGQMFNILKYYRTDRDFYSEHPMMYLNTPQGDYAVMVYSTILTDTQSIALRTDFSDEADKQAFIDYTLRENLLEHNTGVEVTADDHIITLVTCSYETNNSRTVVCGKLVPLN